MVGYSLQHDKLLGSFWAAFIAFKLTRRGDEGPNKQLKLHFKDTLEL
jgi:hypothetical protein